jgi:hypothetical protein
MKKKCELIQLAHTDLSDEQIAARLKSTPCRCSQGREAVGILPPSDCAQTRRQAEGEKMSEPLSLSIFTIEADRKPLLAFAAKKHQEAEDFAEMRGSAPNSDQ